jgi:hypothetical protein
LPISLPSLLYRTVSLYKEKILKHPGRQVFDVITYGPRLMTGCRRPIRAADKWAIVACGRPFRRKSIADAGGPDAREAP